MSFQPPGSPDHFPPWTQGDATDPRGQIYRLTKFDQGLTPAAGMPLVYKNPGYVFGQVATTGLTDSSVTLAKMAPNSVNSSKIVDGSIVDADVNAAAAIAYSKLALANSIVTGDIVNGTILDADINAAAAIAVTKLLAGTNGQLLATESGAAGWRSNAIQLFFNNSSGALTLSNVFQDVPGCTRTVVTSGANPQCAIIAMFDFSTTVVGTTGCNGCLNINGVDNGIVCFMPDVVARETAVLCHVFSVPAGSNTIKMRARKLAAAGTATVPTTNPIMVTIWLDL